MQRLNRELGLSNAETRNQKFIVLTSGGVFRSRSHVIFPNVFISFVVRCSVRWSGALILLTLPAFAQQNYIIPAKPSNNTECLAQVEALDGIIQKLRPLPAKWNWVVVCELKTWDKIVKDLPSRFHNSYGFTDRKISYTYLKGWLLLDPPADAEPGYIVAHELGHIMNESDSEKAADDFAFRLGYVKFRHHVN